MISSSFRALAEEGVAGRELGGVGQLRGGGRGAD